MKRSAENKPRRSPASAWNAFIKKTRNSKPHAEVLRAAKILTPQIAVPRVAIELGSGAGADALFLQRAGFQVHAVDWNTLGLRALRTKLKIQTKRAVRPGVLLPKLEIHRTALQKFALPRAGLITAVRSLGFLPAKHFRQTLRRILAALAPGGVTVLFFFGPRDSWMKSKSVQGLSLVQVRALLKGFRIVELTQKEYNRAPVNKPVKHWHEIVVIAQRKSGKR